MHMYAIKLELVLVVEGLVYFMSSVLMRYINNNVHRYIMLLSKTNLQISITIVSKNRIYYNVLIKLSYTKIQWSNGLQF